MLVSLGRLCIGLSFLLCYPDHHGGITIGNIDGKVLGFLHNRSWEMHETEFIVGYIHRIQYIEKDQIQCSGLIFENFEI